MFNILFDNSFITLSTQHCLPFAVHKEKSENCFCQKFEKHVLKSIPL